MLAQKWKSACQRQRTVWITLVTKLISKFKEGFLKNNLQTCFREENFFIDYAWDAMPTEGVWAPDSMNTYNLPLAEAPNSLVGVCFVR